jgi:ubiquinol-cytochrome c reductase cytochrome c1 subunit
MKKWIAGLLLLPTLVFASGDSVRLEKAPDVSNDLARLQKGAKLFINNCLTCHAASMMRYSALKKIGLDEKTIKDYLLFTSESIGDTMNVAMRMKDAKEWFGAAPPDLTVVARSRASHDGSGQDWLYTYLRTFYRDASRPTGWNNLTYPNVAMPHVLWESQGPVEVTIDLAEEKKDEKTGAIFAHVVKKQYSATGEETVLKDERVNDYKGHLGMNYVVKHLDPVKEKQYREDVADLAAFLDYMSEPNRANRKLIGSYFMIALCLLAFVTWRLNKAFWKDVK